MISRARWTAECKLMHNRFSGFEPFAKPQEGTCGFAGTIVGPRSGTKYTVTLRASIADYPWKKPGVYIEPRPEPHCYEGSDGRLSICPREPSDPMQDTFAQLLVFAFQYVREFDGKPEEVK